MLLDCDYEPHLQRDRSAWDHLRFHEIAGAGYWTGGQLLRKAADGGDGCVRFEKLTAEFRWAVVFRGDNGCLLYVMDLGRTVCNGTNLRVELFPAEEPAGRIDNVDAWLAEVL